MEMVAENEMGDMEEVKKGGLHYMASMEDKAGTETFWYMLVIGQQGW